MFGANKTEKSMTISALKLITNFIGNFIWKTFTICRNESSWLNHETIIQTGITCKKIPFYIHDLACRRCTDKNA